MRLKDMGIALLFGAGFLFAAGTGSAQVVEGEYVIVDDRNDLVEAFLSSVEDSNFVGVTAECVSGVGENQTSVVFFADTNHPDDVRINRNKADVRQRNKDNPNAVFIEVTEPGGETVSGSVFNCRSAKVEASVNTRREPNNGNFRVDVRECDTSLSTSQVNIVAETCAGTREINGSYSASEQRVRRLRINGRGEAILD